ncbi:class I SAM-dependent methyltransferase [Actinopolymorpha pittospori]
MEIGLGTGRVGLDLARRGVEVIGVETSPAMIEQFRRKPDAELVQVVLGDFLEVDVPRPASLVYCVFGTFFQLAGQEQQLRCFEVVRGLLADGGRFVVEAPVPDLTGFARGQRVTVDRSPDGSIHFIAVERHQAATQRLTTEIFLMQPEGRHVLLPLTMRYAYPDELDLMARQAGLKLLERWSDWKQTPFRADSHRHISVYG